MIWLILSILCSVLLMVGFKLFSKYEVDTFNAIVINYLTCVAIGIIPVVLTTNFSTVLSGNFGWLPLAFVLGSMFIGLFFLIGTTTQKIGVSVATVSMKLGYIVPIFLAFFFYKESVTVYKILGIILTIFAVVFTSLKFKSNDKESNVSSDLKPIFIMLFPLIIFIGSGLADSIVQYVEKVYFKSETSYFFILMLFSTASILGLIFTFMQEKTASRFSKKNVIAGVLLGIPNYGSIYFMIKALGTPNWESSMVFPINNISIVVVSTVIAVLFFSEKLTWLNKTGLLLAVVSIVLMSPNLIEIVKAWF